MKQKNSQQHKIITSPCSWSPMAIPPWQSQQRPDLASSYDRTWYENALSSIPLTWGEMVSQWHPNTFETGANHGHLKYGNIWLILITCDSFLWGPNRTEDAFACVNWQRKQWESIGQLRRNMQKATWKNFWGSLYKEIVGHWSVTFQINRSKLIRHISIWEWLSFQFSHLAAMHSSKA